MTDDKVDDAVTHFTEYVQQFHAYYRDRPEFQERLDILAAAARSLCRARWRCDRHGLRHRFFSFYLAETGARVVGVDGGCRRRIC